MGDFLVVLSDTPYPQAVAVVFEPGKVVVAAA